MSSFLPNSTIFDNHELVNPLVIHHFTYIKSKYYILRLILNILITNILFYITT